jgi:hypothetical protein
MCSAAESGRDTLAANRAMATIREQAIPALGGENTRLKATTQTQKIGPPLRSEKLTLPGKFGSELGYLRFTCHAKQRLQHLGHTVLVVAARRGPSVLYGKGHHFG